MSAETNRAVVLRWIEEAVNRGNLAVADEVVAVDCIEHVPGPGLASGREGPTQRVAGFRAAFPDLHVTR